MGLFWDLMQDSNLSKARMRAKALEERVEDLEDELDQTRELLYKLLQKLETHFGEDIDQDGSIG